jgi:hypothetical protein
MFWALNRLKIMKLIIKVIAPSRSVKVLQLRTFFAILETKLKNDFGFGLDFGK